LTSLTPAERPQIRRPTATSTGVGASRDAVGPLIPALLLRQERGRQARADRGFRSGRAPTARRSRGRAQPLSQETGQPTGSRAPVVGVELRMHRDVGVCSIGHDELTVVLLLRRQRRHATPPASGLWNGRVGRARRRPLRTHAPPGEAECGHCPHQRFRARARAEPTIASATSESRRSSRPCASRTIALVPPGLRRGRARLCSATFPLTRTKSTARSRPRLAACSTPPPRRR
jgi:hypothetical protein